MMEFTESVVDLRYLSYSTGRYFNGRQAGITVSFESEASGRDYYAIFNVELNRLRATKKYAAGDPLPDKQFRVGRRYEFYKFWKRSGLAMPPRLSSFHDYMGNLKVCTFQGLARNDGKLTNKSLALVKPTSYTSDVDWPYDALIERIYGRGNYLQESDKWHAPFRQAPDTHRTTSPYKQCAETPIFSTFSADESTCSSKYELRNKGSTTKEDRGVEDWLNDYDQADAKDYSDVPF